jgi:hypothetical protein
MRGSCRGNSKTRRKVSLSPNTSQRVQVDHDLANELNLIPSSASPYGAIQWLEQAAPGGDPVSTPRWIRNGYSKNQTCGPRIQFFGSICQSGTSNCLDACTLVLSSFHRAASDTSFRRNQTSLKIILELRQEPLDSVRLGFVGQYLRL